MKRTVLSSPPNPERAQYQNNPLAYNRALYDWACSIKSDIELASQQNDMPLGQSFVIGSFTTNTSLDGTSTDVTNFVCTLVQAMINQGWMRTKITTP